MKQLVLTLIALASLSADLKAELILSETFNYPNGAIDAAAGSPWTGHSGTAGTALVQQKKLEVFSSRAEDIGAPLSGGPYKPGTGTVLFASFKLACTNLPSVPGTYFAHLKDSTSTGFRGRIFASTTNAAPGSFRLSVANGTGENVATFPLDLALKTEYLVVLRYEVDTTASTLWINPVLEGDTRVTANDFLAGPVSVVTFAFRQASGAGSLLVDNLKVGTAFNDVAGPNSPPTLSAIAEQRIPAGTSSAPILFSIEDVESPGEDLFVIAFSSNQRLVSDESFVFGGTSSDRSLVITPQAAEQGETVITVAVYDPDNNFSLTTFRLVVGAPGISRIPDQATPANSSTGPIPFTVTDGETSPKDLVVAVTTSNPALLPPGNVALGGSDAHRTLTLTPAANQAGLTTVTVSVSDGIQSAAATFILTVTPRLGVIATDDFDRGDGSIVDGSGLWLHHSGTFGEAQLVGNQLKLDAALSEDISIELAGAPFGLSSGAVIYASFTVLFSELPTGTGGFFAHFKDDSAGNFRGRLFASTANAARGSFRLGVANNAGAIPSSAQISRDLETNRTYQVVLRYNVGTGVSTLWVDPTAESDPGITASDAPSLVDISNFAFRQNAGIGTVLVDNLIIGGAFGDVVVSREIRLKIVHSPTGISVSWPVSASGFVLQSNVGISPGLWTNYAGAPVAEGDEKVITLTSFEKNRFFRLIKSK